LVGVTIKLKGKASTAGSTTTTDAGGNYSIEAKKGQTIVFSFVGTIAQERIVGADPVINISLNEDPKSLDAVVVVGYGNQKKSNLTGAVAVVDVEKTLGSRPVPDLARGLQGSSPGLLITTSSGNLGTVS
jgi:hypothetical protein